MQPLVPSRVLMTADTVGGVWTYTIELARALAAEGVEVAVAAMGRRPSPEQREEARTVPGLRLFESEFRLPWMDDPWDDVRAAGEWLLDVAGEAAPDLVHVNDPVYAALPWPAPTLAVGHSCVLSWWEAVHHEPAPPAWDRYREAMRDGLAAAGAVIAPSRPMLAALRRYYGVTRGRVIANGRDPGRFAPGKKEPFIFTAGRLWDRGKNVAALERAATWLPWPVYVAGDDRHPDQDGNVQAPSTQHDGIRTNRPSSAWEDGACTRRLRLLGRLSSAEVAVWLARASVYALPARYEPFGLSIVEAALAGCALVLGDVPSLRELWDGVAVFVDPDDPDTLHAALDALVVDVQLRQTLAMRARRRALGLTPRRMAAQYLDVYAALLSGGTPAIADGGTAAGGGRIVGAGITAGGGTTAPLAGGPAVGASGKAGVCAS